MRVIKEAGEDVCEARERRRLEARERDAAARKAWVDEQVAKAPPVSLPVMRAAYRRFGYTR